jgi:hypothetical protein
MKKRSNASHSDAPVRGSSDALAHTQSTPRYEADDGPLSDEQLANIREMVPQGRFKAKPGKSLLDLQP